MNKIIVTAAHKIMRSVLFVASMLMLTISSFAQDTKAVDVNINAKSDGGFFTNPIVWVIGGAVFILLLVALMRNNSKGNA